MPENGHQQQGGYKGGDYQRQGYQTPAKLGDGINRRGRNYADK
ncbi:MAG: hypothetical protein PHG36_07895 [Dehalococcoidia bacterium]|nr:hypothetical protein [Dehalococcoidia bacterium]